MQIKVTNTKIYKSTYGDKQYRDAPNEVLVVEGKLVLVKCIAGDSLLWQGYKGDLKLSPYYTRDIKNKYYKPIIISETEKIEIGDWMYEAIGHNIFKKEFERIYTSDYKILALPEHFSPKHFQAIVDGKMKDGDKVLVECEEKGDISVTETDKNNKPEQWVYLKIKCIKLNQSNHIAFHKVEEKMYTKEEIKVLMNKLVEDSSDGMIYKNEYNNGDGHFDSDGPYLEPNAFNKWFEQNIK